MQKLLLKNIKQLLQVREEGLNPINGQAMKDLPVIEDAWLAIEEGRILEYGTMDDFPGITDWKGLEVMDCSGKIVMPCYADSHTHIVYAGNREKEFVDRINGLSYEAIAQNGGGILNSAALLRQTSEDELFEQSLARLHEIINLGTGSVEIKSGYGLDVESELKMLRVIKRLKDENLIPIKATFLGAHALPKEFKDNKAGYIRLITEELLPKIASEHLADFIDVFCEKNYFTAEETIFILNEGLKHGLVGKVHAEQLSYSGGIAAAVLCKAISVDHLEFCTVEDMQLLQQSSTIPTILPGAAFFLNLPLPPARQMIEHDLPVAFASDYNPGSSPSGNMNFMMSLGCIQYKLTPEEMINATTINSAAAMNVLSEVGSITKGKLANIIITKPISSYAYIPYSFGNTHIEQVLIKGIRLNL
jgi:imidazolonepropionase